MTAANFFLPCRKREQNLMQIYQNWASKVGKLTTRFSFTGICFLFKKERVLKRKQRSFILILLLARWARLRRAWVCIHVAHAYHNMHMRLPMHSDFNWELW